MKCGGARTEGGGSPVHNLQYDLSRPSRVDREQKVRFIPVTKVLVRFKTKLKELNACTKVDER